MSRLDRPRTPSATREAPGPDADETSSPPEPRNVDVRANHFGRVQFGLATRRQLAQVGIGPRTIHRRAAAGTWEESDPGMIDLGTHEPSWARDVVRALLLAGPDGAWVSHGTAAALHGLLDEPRRSHVHVLVPRGRRRDARGVSFHTARELGDDEVTSVALTVGADGADGARPAVPSRSDRAGDGRGATGQDPVVGRAAAPPSDAGEDEGPEAQGAAGYGARCPATSVARTVLDLAAERPTAELEPMLWDAARHDATLMPGLAKLVARHPRHRGRRTVADLLQGVHPNIAAAESPLEVAGLIALRDLGLPWPELQYVLRDGRGRFVARVDAAWPAARLAVEFDGTAYHTTPRQREADRVRRDRVRALGWQVIGLRARDLRGPALRRVAAELRTRAASPKAATAG